MAGSYNEVSLADHGTSVHPVMVDEGAPGRFDHPDSLFVEGCRVDPYLG